MRALVVTGPRQAEVQHVPDPHAASGELLVDVERVGICGTDVELYTGEMAYIDQGFTHFPLRLGHEWAGRVVAAGSPEDEGWIGKRVTGDTMLGCGQCEYCRSGHHHVCPNRFEVGIRDGWAGALAEQMLVPTRFAHEIPENVSVTSAALVEPGGNSLRAVRAAHLRAGQKVLVLGSGTIGLLAAQFALADGVEVHVAGVREGSLALARSLGVQHTWQLHELADGRHDEFDAVIEATSNESMPALAVQLTKPAGRVVYIGLSAEPSLVDTRDIALKDITVVGILSASPGLAGTIERFASGSVNPDAIVSEVISLEDVPDRLEGHRGASAGPGPKIHVDPHLIQENP
ncbi:zinc-dependent alcohol dehydrogenase [Arthrobacter sedimenti]|uniref:zinc-dependent alcohol dehydrogenase n=1 Tax=Arthrobacter sedimenti TaxID=2694931 RepID=UPI000B35C5B5|nr:alcohol dehydrogenase catalytic domain-containing protein [Arthrobacter sedimenti]OUM41713.1 alcohol dehydrogenase [Arthrobacter agilis]